MRRSWIYVLAILGIVATSSGFTVERSNPESFRSRNWTTPVLQPHRRASVPNVLSHEIRPADAINILRDSELREFVKRPNKKHSTFSEDPQHMERSGDASGPTNRSRIAEKMTLEPKESMPGYSILTSSKDRTNSDPTFVTSTGNSKSPGSTNVTSQKETRTPESSIAVGTSGIKVKTLRAPISISSKETRSAESTIGTFSQETGNPGSTIAPSSEEMKSSELPRAHTGMEIDHRKTSSDKNTDVEILKNVVLLLIDDSATGQGNYLRHFLDRHKFPVRGFLQNCNSVKIPEIVKFSLGDSLVSGKVDADCRCNRFLRANVGNLLSWARHVKDMTTGVVTTTNFSVPLPLNYESPANLLVKSFEDSDEISAVHQDIPRFKSDSNEMWHLTDSVKQMVRDKRSVPSTSATPNIDIVPRQDAVNGFDGMWNVFDMFSRIRTAFFRILLESLGNMSASEDELGGKRPMASQPSLVGLVAETLREFQSVPNDNGFVLVAAAPENELTDAVDLLHRQFTTKDTLFVISGICSSTNEPVPFVAHGPGATSLHEARTMWDIPVLIKEAMIAACSVKSCKNERPEDSVALPSVELASLHDELPRNRIGRSVTKDAVTKEAVTKETVTKKAVSEGAVTKEAATKENVTKEVATKEAAPKEAAPKEAAPKEAATKEAAPKEAAPKEAAPKEAAPKEGATKGAATKEALTKESVTEEAVTKEAVNKEALTKESSTKEAATEEAVTKEAVNKEALTKNETITTFTTSAAKPMNVTDTETENDTATSEIGRRSGAADIRNDNGASIFGIITSTATILALHSA